jgi:hypothetical protein
MTSTRPLGRDVPVDNPGAMRRGQGIGDPRGHGQAGAERSHNFGGAEAGAGRE